jgi:hypothetical protein
MVLLSKYRHRMSLGFVLLRSRITMQNEAIVKVIFGIRGGGKTVKLRRLLLDCNRSLTINTLNRDGFTNGVVFNNIPDLKKFWKTVYRRKFRLIYSPDHGDLDRTCIEVGEICKLVMACGHMTFAIEEMNVLFEDLRTPSEFNQIVFAGRDPGIELIGVAQQPVGFGAAMRSMTKEAFIFHTHEDSHLAVFRKLVGKEAAERIRTLSNYEYLHWSLADGAEKWEVKKDEPLPYM